MRPVSAHSGFTLVEILLIMVLISISVALVYPSLINLRDKFDAVVEDATVERNKKKETFAKFASDGLPFKNISSPAKP